MKMNLLNFAIAPLSKYGENFEELDKEYPPQAIYRTEHEDKIDHTIWPIILRRQQQQDKEEDLLIILHALTEKEREFALKNRETETEIFPAFYSWMKEYSLLVKQAEGSENEALAELLIRHCTSTIPTKSDLENAGI